MANAAPVTIWHNPVCGTSRKTLARLEEAGLTPTIIQYLKTPPSREELAGAIAAAGISVREALRQKGDLYTELGLADESLTDDALLDAMIAHPALIERPFVFTSRGVRLCRPMDKVEEII
ncbi:arsenate reductase (glutaredoxin) [Xanthobacter sp. TB0139]|uniref:arsenate reductase (glutaredoxin) n=1 Tax=Xanthobacter sp. TB0139 TaxID=3459178 RepID=UPI00403A226F